MAILTKAPNDPLAFGEVRRFFHRLYLPANGVALDDLGTVTYNSGDFAAWPGNAGFIQAASGISYAAPITPGSGGAFDNTGTLTNNSGVAIDLTNARLDVDINITNIGTVSGNTMPSVVIAHPSRTETVIMTATTTSTSNTGPVTLSTTTASGSDLSWENGGTLGIYFSTTDNTIRPFTAIVRSVRLSFTQTELQQTEEALSAYNRGGGIVPTTNSTGQEINTTISSDNTRVSLSSLRNVDDGEP